MNKPPSRTALLLLVFLSFLLMAGCRNIFRRNTPLIPGSYETPTPYLTPFANGTPASLITPYPKGTPVFDGSICRTVAGNQYLTRAGVLYYAFKIFRSTADEVSHEDLPAIIDKMREIHDEFRDLNPPPECEILVELDFAYEAEIDQTLRGFIAFRNLEPEEVYSNYYFNEALFYKNRVKELLDRIY